MLDVLLIAAAAAGAVAYVAAGLRSRRRGCPRARIRSDGG
jgi:hypothetical protein